MTHATPLLFKSKPTTALAFQWNPHEEDFAYPKWFSEMLNNGAAFTVNNDREQFITVQNKRGVYRGLAGDWVCSDQFGHVHIVSQKTFNQRYEPSNQKGN